MLHSSLSFLMFACKATKLVIYESKSKAKVSDTQIHSFCLALSSSTGMLCGYSHSPDRIFMLYKTPVPRFSKLLLSEHLSMATKQNLWSFLINKQEKEREKKVTWSNAKLANVDNCPGAPHPQWPPKAQASL